MTSTPLSTVSPVPASLPMVAFERYMLADDRPTLPMAYFIRFVFSGTLDPAAFEAAINEALARHPLLNATITGQSFRDYTWVVLPTTDLKIDDGPWGAPLVFRQGEAIDLREERGLRVWIRRNADRAEVRFQFHHSCSDGVGAYRFIDEVLSRYHNRLAPKHAVPSRKLEPARLSKRADFGMSAWRRWLRMPIDVWGLIIGGINFFLFTPQELALPKAEPIDPESLRRLPDFPVARLTPDQLARLSAAAKRRGLTLNDLVTSELFLVLEQWRRQQGHKPRGFFRIMVPINVRSPQDETLPAANIVGMVPVDRGGFWLRRPEGLRRSVSIELRYLKYFRFGLVFLSMCRMFEILLGGLGRLLDNDRCQTTLTYSNMGRACYDSPLKGPDGRLRLGGLTLEQVESGPPIRPHTPVSFSSLWYAGQFTLVTIYDRRQMTRATADALLAMIVEHLRRTFDLDPTGQAASAGG